MSMKNLKTGCKLQPFGLQLVVTNFSKGVEMDDKEIAKIMGHRIRVARVARKMSQRELADKLGFSSQFLSKLETGKKMISTEKLVYLGAALSLPLDFFSPFIDNYMHYLDEPSKV